MVTFIGFPAGGFAAMLLVGPVDNLLTAAVGGPITGAILGAAQAFGLRRRGTSAWQWISANCDRLDGGRRPAPRPRGSSRAPLDPGTGLPPGVGRRSGMPR
jgi:hypothetical protein